jgi:hypothetical protein
LLFERKLPTSISQKETVFIKFGLFVNALAMVLAVNEEILQQQIGHFTPHLIRRTYYRFVTNGSCHTCSESVWLVGFLSLKFSIGGKLKVVNIAYQLKPTFTALSFRYQTTC